MNLYLDEDCAKSVLVARLRKSGHTAVIPADVSLMGISDPRHLLHAVTNNLVLLTRNYDDFEDLDLLIQASNGRHPGILVVRNDNDATRDMTDAQILQAIRKLEASGAPIENQFHILNHWR